MQPVVPRAVSLPLMASSEYGVQKYKRFICAVQMCFLALPDSSFREYDDTNE